MKGSTKASSRKPFVKCWILEAKYKSKLLSSEIILYTFVPLLLSTSAVVSLAQTPQQIAPIIAQDNIYRPTLQLGSQGQPVSELQAALKLLGFYTDTVDGIYNEITAAAVSQFQQAAGLNPNGIVDVNTWQRLFPSEIVLTPTSSSNPPNNFSVPTQSVNTPKTVATTSEPKPVKPPKQTTPANSQNKPKVQSSSTHTQQTTRSQTNNRRSQQTPGIQYTPEGFPILRLGMRGSEVVKLQKILKRQGLLKGDVDGNFGKATEAAAIALQKRYGIEADGVVGGATWEVLLQQH
ncbi:peptidoglycan-binding domain-containing protein [Chlorogloeopsis sp. ULAP01]|uniref:peptidoglycan-binding domain-containing protein n=1 Tax=Chlorogloeopsis sp. ULAP01 TaxID=3056483 RepID=UPI0025AA7321|nr:peptidoglycan-binding domain-containing protein [Chlorogloeopsis sp. ULAP01]MDM9385618.1 peptidoglycan-binding domain-containing protein [Chlorogloeopsis sp. ULAP01]